MHRLLIVLALALATLLVACGGGDAVPVGAPTAGPFDALPACADIAAEPIAMQIDVLLPDEAQVLERTVQGPLTFVTVYVEMTPPEIRAWYEAADGVELLISEDEIFEVELLVSDSLHRAYLKGTAACRTGTSMTIVVADELEGAPDLLPDDAFRAGNG